MINCLEFFSKRNCPIIWLVLEIFCKLSNRDRFGCAIISLSVESFCLVRGRCFSSIYIKNLKTKPSTWKAFSILGNVFNNYSTKLRGISPDTEPTRPYPKLARIRRYSALQIEQDNWFFIQWNEFYSNLQDFRRILATYIYSTIIL